MALLFLHYAPEVELCGIVTGFGNASVENTTRNTLFLKEFFNIDAPVYQGAAGPIGDRLGDGYPDLFTTQQTVVRVATDGIAIGQTIFCPPDATFESRQWQDKPVVRICTDVDSDGLLALYGETLSLASD
jgi:inosine-uridine nucleoside N-ribohydrolase